MMISVQFTMALRMETVRVHIILYPLKLKACNALGSGFLNSGLTLTITTIAQNTNDVVKDFYTQLSATDTTDAAAMKQLKYNFVSSPTYPDAIKLVAARNILSLLFTDLF